MREGGAIFLSANNKSILHSKLKKFRSYMKMGTTNINMYIKSNVMTLNILSETNLSLQILYISVALQNIIAKSSELFSSSMP